MKNNIYIYYKMKLNKKTEKSMLNIFEAIDQTKEAQKVFLIHSMNSPDLNQYKMQILTSSEVNETLDYLQYILASNSKFSKRVSNMSSSIIQYNTDLMEKCDNSDIVKTVIKCNTHLLKCLDKLKEL